MLNKLWFALCVLLLSVSISADVPVEVHVKNLSSGSDSDRISACYFLGKEKKESKYLSEIQEVLKTTDNSRVAVACANALGYIQEKGSSTTALKNKIMSESNSDVVYACLASIVNIAIKNGYEADAKSAVQYSDINHRSDEFVADLIDRIKKDSMVTVIGAGGLGSPVLYYLAAAGVGAIQIIDSDKVDLTNLQRQILYNTSSVNKDKAEEAESVLRSLNPNLSILSQNARLTAANIEGIFQGSNLIIEGSDNFETKFLVNDACHFLSIPLILAGILRFEGQVIGILPKQTSCYRCIFHSPPDADSVPNCGEAGVIGSVAGIIGSIQATESIKFLLGQEQGIFGSILSVDAKTMEFRKISIPKNKACPLCGDNPSITKIEDIVLKTCDWE